MNKLSTKALILVVLSYLIVSCATTKYVEVPVEVVKTEYVQDIKKDSVFIYIKDSVERYSKNDTVYIYRDRIKYKYLYKIDTLTRIDSIPKVIRTTEIKEVKINYLKWYQEALMWAGGVWSLFFCIYMLIKIKLR